MRFPLAPAFGLALLAVTTLSGCAAALIPLASSMVVAKRVTDPSASAPAPPPSPSPTVIVETARPHAEPVALVTAEPAADPPPPKPAKSAKRSKMPPPPAELPVVAKLEVPRIDVAHMQDMVRTLSSDDFAGRAPSTNEEGFVLDTIVRQFEAAGLKPGNNGSWLQQVPTTEITGSNFSQLSVSGGVQQVAYQNGTEYVAVSPSGPPLSELKNAEMVFVGYGIVAPELGWNDYAGIDMTGKVAVVLVNDPDYQAADGQATAGAFGGRRMTYYGRWTYKMEEAVRQGAAGVLLVHDPYPAGYGWNVVQSGWTGPQRFVDNGAAPANPTIVQGWVQLAVAKEMFRAARKDFGALSKAAQQPGFTAVPLGIKASLSFVNAIRKSSSYNIVGVLPGTQRPGEYVLYTAHWDHLGNCAPEARDKICNGAVDNATGVAALAEIAAMNTRAGAPARSEVFIATTLEESGLLGSEYYAQHPLFPLGKTAGGLNIDSLRPGGWTRDVVSTGGDRSELTPILEAALGEMRLKNSPEPHPEQGSYYRSDHFSLAKRGVPMLDLARGFDLTRGGPAAGEAAAKDYEDNRYHAPGDEYSPDWEWSGIMQDVEMFYRVGRMLANSSAWPNWHSGDEFRSERDKSAGERGQ